MERLENIKKLKILYITSKMGTKFAISHYAKHQTAVYCFENWSYNMSE